MLFNEYEIDELEFFKDTALILNTIYVAFKRFDINLISHEKPVNQIDFDLDRILQDFKTIIFKLNDIFNLDEIYIDRDYLKKKIIDIINELNHSLMAMFALYGGDNDSYVSSTLMRLYDFLNNVQNLLINVHFDVVGKVPEIIDFNIRLDGLKNNKIFLQVRGKDVDFNIMFNDLLLVKREVLDLKEKYSEFLIDHKNSTSVFIEDQRVIFRSTIDKLSDEFKTYIYDLKNKYDFDVKKDLDELSLKIEANLDEMKQLGWDINSYKSIASEQTQNEISKHYSLKARSEKRTYWYATSATITLILLSLGLVGWALYDYYTNYISISNCVGKEDINTCLANLRAVRDATQSFGLTFFIMRFAFSLLLFLTVIYTSRIAIRAYNHWRHSENMHLKLASLNPFIGNLDKDKRDEIHIGLVPDYFGKDSGVVEIQNDGLKDIPTNIANVAIKALEQAGGTFGGKSNTEKNGKKSEGGTE